MKNTNFSKTRGKATWIRVLMMLCFTISAITVVAILAYGDPIVYDEYLLYSSESDDYIYMYEQSNYYEYYQATDQYHPYDYVNEAPTYIGITPFNGGFNATISGGLGPNPIINFTNTGHEPFVVDVLGSTTIGQVLTVTAEFTDSFTSNRTVNISLQNGLAFQSAPGMVPNHAEQPDNWTFDAGTLLAPFPGVITNATYTQNPLFVQSISGNTYQPRAGTLTYTIAAGITSISIPVMIVSDSAFHLFAGDIATNTRFHEDAITVTTSETGEPSNTATLQRYVLNGPLDIWLEAPERLAVGIHPPGPGEASRWATNTHFRVGHPFPGQLLHETISFTVQVPKAVTSYADLSVTRPATSGIAAASFSYSIDTLSHPVYHLVTITLTQANINTRNTFVRIAGEVPPGTPVGDYIVNGLTPANIGTTVPSEWANVTMLRVLGDHTVRVIPEGQLNHLTLLPMMQNGWWSGTPGITPLAPLGGFLALNEITSPLTDQAVRVSFPDETLELIGVRAFRLPAGVSGIRNVTATTVFLQTDINGNIVIDANGRAIIDTGQPGNTIEINGPIGLTGTFFGFPFSTLNFDGQLAANEFIAELYYELYGDVPVGASYLTVHQFRHTNSMTFLYLGRILNPDGIAAGTQLLAHAVGGEKCDVNPDGSGIHANLRDSATTTMIASAFASASLNLITSANVNDQTVIAGTTVQDVTVTVPMNDIFQYLPVTFGVQGFFVYLRSPAGVFSVDRGTIVASWSGNTYSEAQGNLTMDALTDSTGSTVYRLRMESPVWELQITGIPRHTPLSPIEVNFDIMVHPAAPAISIPLRYLFMTSTISEHITIPAGMPVVANDFRTITLTDALYIGSARGDNRTNVGQAVGARPFGPTDFNQALSFLPLADIVVYTQARQNAGSTIGSWTDYSWTTRQTIVDLNPDGEIQYRVAFVNNTDRIVTEFYTLVPIPRAGEWVVDQTAATDSGVQRDDFPDFAGYFEWSMMLASNPPAVAGFEFLFSNSYTLTAAGATFHPWSNFASNPEDIRTVLIRATQPIPVDGTAEFILTMDIHPDADRENDSGKINRFSAMVFRNVPTFLEGYAPSEPAALRLRTGTVEGRVFRDYNRNGIQNPGEPGINGVIVRVYDAVTSTLLTTTETQNIGGIDGRWAVLTLDPDQEVNIAFLNPGGYFFSTMSPPLTIAQGHARATAMGVRVGADINNGWQHRQVNAGLFTLHPWDALRFLVNTSPINPVALYRIYVNNIVGGWGACGAEDPGAIIIPANRRIELVSESGNTGVVGSLERVLGQPTANQRHFQVEGELVVGSGVTLCGALHRCGHAVHCNPTTPVTPPANFATRLRGGVEVISLAAPGGRLTVEQGSTIRHNRFTNGGGVQVGATATFTMTGGIIRNNVASYGGGVYLHDGSSANIDGICHITANQAVYDGGGVWAHATALMEAAGLHITNNQAGRLGGGIFTANYEYDSPITRIPPGASPLYYAYSNLTLSGVTFGGNTADALHWPPSNAAVVIPGTAFIASTTSQPATVTGTRRHPLNNFDINFEFAQSVTFYFLKTDNQLYATSPVISLLSGAQFRVFRAVDPDATLGTCENYLVVHGDPRWEEVEFTSGQLSPDGLVATSGASGAQVMGFVMDPRHYYQIVETVSPVGYQMPFGQWRVSFDVENDVFVAPIAIGGMAPEFIDSEDTRLAGVTHPAMSIDDWWYVGNVPQMMLPMTGGGGNMLLFTGIGFMLFGVLGAVYLYVVRHKSGTPLPNNDPPNVSKVAARRKSSDDDAFYKAC